MAVDMKYMGQVKGKAYPILQRLPEKKPKEEKKLPVRKPPKPMPKIEKPKPKKQKKREPRTTCKECGRKLPKNRRTFCCGTCQLEGRRKYAEAYRREQREKRRAERIKYGYEEDDGGAGVEASA